jgi:hypothetical protein
MDGVGSKKRTSKAFALAVADVEHESRKSLFVSKVYSLPKVSNVYTPRGQDKR